MKIELHWHNQTRFELRPWSRSFRERYRNAESLVRVYLDGINQTLIATKGAPVGAIEVPNVKPTIRWWEFAPGWWIRFAVRLHPPSWLIRLFRGSVLRITILELTNKGPR